MSIVDDDDDHMKRLLNCWARGMTKEMFHVSKFITHKKKYIHIHTHVFIKACQNYDRWVQLEHVGPVVPVGLPGT